MGKVGDVCEIFWPSWQAMRGVKVVGWKVLAKVVGLGEYGEADIDKLRTG